MLSDARRLGFLGPGALEDHVDHALGFVAAAGRTPSQRVVDLGSGGGVPGLILALTWPDVALALVDSNQGRTAFLDDATARLGLGGRVKVVRARAEELGRENDWRDTSDLVVARSFARPAVVAECAAPLLRLGGQLVVSEPPGAEEARWPAGGLAPLGLGPGRVVRHGGRGYRVLPQQRRCPPRFPRRTGIPAKRPLF